jgi:tetratricopeptide (TPR) repeat protein
MVPAYRRKLIDLLTKTGRQQEVEKVHRQAESVIREELAARRKLLGNEHPEVAATLHDLAQALQQEGKLAEAETTAREAVQKYHTAMAQYEKQASDRNRHQECWRFAISYEELGQFLKQIGQTQEAEKAYRDTQVLWRKLAGDFNTEDYRFHLAVNHDALGKILRETGRATESLEAYRDAQAIWLKLVADSNLEDRRVHLGWTDDDIGQLLKEAGRFDEAAEAYRQALAVWRQLVAEFNKDAYRARRFGTLVSLAATLQTQGKLAEAKSMYREAGEGGSASELNELAWSFATTSDPNLRDGTNAVVFAEKAVAATNRKHVGYLDTLAAVYAETGQFAKAIRIQQEAVALSQSEPEKKDLASRLELYENNSPYRDHSSLAELARNLLVEGKFAEAEGLARECLAIRELQIPGDWRTFNTRSMLGGALLGQKNYAAAEPLLLSGYEGMKQRESRIPPAGKPRLKESLQRLVQLYEATNRPDKAAEWKQKLAEFDKTEK